MERAGDACRDTIGAGRLYRAGNCLALQDAHGYSSASTFWNRLGIPIPGLR